MASDAGRLVRLRRSGELGTAFPAFRDAHVHLGLIDPSPLPASGIGGVVDLGWSPDVTGLAAAAPVETSYAGCFLAAPGGYPSDRAWAPEGSTRAVTDTGDAVAAVAEQVDRGAALVKVTLHSEAGPVLSPEVLAMVVSASPLPVVAHVEGRGMTERALAAGVQVLAHTPWSERLDDATITRAARTQRWISTLAIHDGSDALGVALDNLRRFHEAGGEVIHGTDLGNGDLPVGLNLRELALMLEAGLRPRALVHALTVPFAGLPRGERRTFVPGRPEDDVLDWLAGAVVVDPGELEEPD